MTHFGKSISIVLVVVVVGLVVWSVSRKPLSPAIVPGVQETQTTQPSQTISTDTSDQSLDQDMTSIDTDMQVLGADASAAAQVE